MIAFTISFDRCNDLPHIYLEYRKDYGQCVYDDATERYVAPKVTFNNNVEHFYTSWRSVLTKEFIKNIFNRVKLIYKNKDDQRLQQTKKVKYSPKF